ncbi:vomeronasal type-2 receptor 26-like isoform X2 [Paroedura picta]
MTAFRVLKGRFPVRGLTYSSALMRNDKVTGLSAYYMVPNEAQQYKGILDLILHFRWIWIGIIVVDDERGEIFLETMLPLLSSNGICLAFKEIFLQATMMDYYMDMLEYGQKISNVLMGSKANVVVIFGDAESVSYLRWLVKLLKIDIPMIKVGVMTAQMDFSTNYYQRSWDLQVLHGFISFTFHASEPPGFQQFLRSRKPLQDEGDSFIKVFWEHTFLCHFSDSLLEKEFVDICTGEEKLDSLPGDVFEMRISGHSYSIYNAVHAVAHALHAMHSSLYKHKTMTDRKFWRHLSQQSWQARPLSVCSESCQPGQSKKMREGEPFCCYECVPCPKGKISTQKDMNDCVTCREDFYPNAGQYQCIPKCLNTMM